MMDHHPFFFYLPCRLLPAHHKHLFVTFHQYIHYRGGEEEEDEHTKKGRWGEEKENEDRKSFDNALF